MCVTLPLPLPSGPDCALQQNVSRVLDCVSCEKCKLHGKLSLLGLGTALKILLVRNAPPPPPPPAPLRDPWSAGS
jgi:hypothetical protein